MSTMDTQDIQAMILFFADKDDILEAFTVVKETKKSG